MEKNGVLLVEGIDDYHVLRQLISIFDIPDSIHIHPVKGVDKIFETFGLTLKAHGMEGINFDIRRLGIVVDSNGNISQRLNDFKKVVTEFGYDYESLPKKGAVIRDDDKDVSVVGLWIMPDNVNTGMLEDFYQYFIPDEDVILPKVNTFIDSLPYKPTPRMKATVRTWLACQEKSEALMGYFLNHNKEILNVHNEHAERFIGWIKQLFIE